MLRSYFLMQQVVRNWQCRELISKTVQGFENLLVDGVRGTVLINFTFLPAVSLSEGFFGQVSEKPMLFAHM